jgi:hypothetical protein
MTDKLNRRSWIGRCLGAVLAGVGMRRAAAAGAAPAACPDPAHVAVTACHPGPGVWYHLRMVATCPHCGGAVVHEGQLPAFGFPAPSGADSPDTDRRTDSFSSSSYAESWRGREANSGEGPP